LVRPNSVQSSWCEKEIAHTILNGKRVLPIVIHKTNGNSIHPEISKRNWIYCRDKQDDFHKAIEDICRTIHTNNALLRSHTKLQVKILDWEQYKDTSWLLRGKELQEAEHLSASMKDSSDIQFTELQQKFV